MGYENGKAQSHDDFLDKIRIFLLNNGWYELMFEEDGTGHRLHMRKTLEMRDLNLKDDLWEQSSLGNNIWYYTGDHGRILLPISAIFVDGSRYTKVDSPSDISDTSDEYAWGDEDDIGEDTLYINFYGTNPNEEDDDYVQFSNDMYVNLRSCWDEEIVSSGKDYGIGINLSTGFNSDDLWDKQPGHSRGLEEDGDGIDKVTQVMIGNMKPLNEYWLFTSGDDVLLMCEPSAEVWVGLAFGRLKETTYDPRDFWYFTGQSETHYDDSHYMNSLFSAPADGYYINENRCSSYIMDIKNERTYYNSDDLDDSMRIIAPLPSSDSNTSGGSGGGFLQYLVGNTIPSEAYKTNALLPMYYAVQFLGDNYQSIVGYIGNIRGLRGGRYDGNDIINLGEDKWHVFPTDSFSFQANDYSIRDTPSKEMCIAILEEE